MVAMPIVEIINGPSVTKTSVSTGWTMDMPVVRARPLTPANAAWKTFSGTRHHANNSRTGWVQFALPPRGPPLPHHRSPCFRARGGRVSALRGTCVRAREPTWLGVPPPAGPRRLGLLRYSRPPMGARMRRPDCARGLPSLVPDRRARNWYTYKFLVSDAGPALPSGAPPLQHD